MSLNRHTPALKQTVGMCSTAVSVWYRLGTELSFVELLAEMKREAQRGAPHRRFPLSELGRALGLLQTGRTRLFDVSLSYLSGAGDVRFGEAKVMFRHLFAGFEQHQLNIYVEDLQTDGPLRLIFDGSETLFAPGDLERLKGRLAALLETVMSRP